MKVLIGCEESQTVCKAFRERGHEAYSCDIKDCSGGHPEWHLKMSVLDAIELGSWDMGIFFPPCTFLSSVQTFRCRVDPYRVLKRIEAAKLFMQLVVANIEKIAIENPTGVMTEIYRSPDQVVHPYYFGDDKMKRTCLWLKNLPLLKHNQVKTLFEESTYGVVPPPEKTWIQKSTGKRKYMRQVNQFFLSSEERSKLSPFLAKAMAEQWSEDLTK
jgi:hypothetical protein